jgi:hypothetical protein
MTTKTALTNANPCPVTLDCQDRVPSGATFYLLHTVTEWTDWTETACDEHVEEALSTADVR